MILADVIKSAAPVSKAINICTIEASNVSGDERKIASLAEMLNLELKHKTSVVKRLVPWSVSLAKCNAMLSKSKDMNRT